MRDVTLDKFYKQGNETKPLTLFCRKKDNNIIFSFLC